MATGVSAHSPSSRVLMRSFTPCVNFTKLLQRRRKALLRPHGITSGFRSTCHSISCDCYLNKLCFWNAPLLWKRCVMSLTVCNPLTSWIAFSAVSSMMLYHWSLSVQSFLVWETRTRSRSVELHTCIHTRIHGSGFVFIKRIFPHHKESKTFSSLLERLAFIFNLLKNRYVICTLVTVNALFYHHSTQEMFSFFIFVSTFLPQQGPHTLIAAACGDSYMHKHTG